MCVLACVPAYIHICIYVKQENRLHYAEVWKIRAIIARQPSYYCREQANGFYNLSGWRAHAREISINMISSERGKREFTIERDFITIKIRRFDLASLASHASILYKRTIIISVRILYLLSFSPSFYVWHFRIEPNLGVLILPRGHKNVLMCNRFCRHTENDTKFCC